MNKLFIIFKINYLELNYYFKKLIIFIFLIDNTNYKNHLSHKFELFFILVQYQSNRFSYLIFSSFARSHSRLYNDFFITYFKVIIFDIYFQFSFWEFIIFITPNLRRYFFRQNSMSYFYTCSLNCIRKLHR